MFNDKFMWGGATAANQFEGGADIGGKGTVGTDYQTAGSVDHPRMMAVEMPDGSIKEISAMTPIPEGGKLVLQPGKYYPNQQAVDFYHRYPEDIKMLADLGLKMFRMSIAWSRIFPTGTETEPNQEGLDFYRRVFTELKKYGIEPLVTISHYDTPQYLEEELGGWSNPELIDLFERYCNTIFTEYKGLVKYWLTFNEINGEIIKTHFAPKEYQTDALMQKTFRALHHEFLASAKAVKLAHSIDPDYMVGCMIAGVVTYPLTPDPADILDNQQYNQENLYYCGDTMVRGEYPAYAQRIWDKYHVDLGITDEQRALLKEGHVDFYSFSYYSTICTTTHDNATSAKGNFALGVTNPYLEVSDWGWSIDGTGLRTHLNDIYTRYQVPIMVVENGLGAHDTLEADNSIHDPYRIQYMQENIAAMSGAVDDGVDLLAYTPWGIIDLISASTGEMAKRYGVIYVDLDDEGNGTRDRFPKDSYYWYQKVIQSNGADLSTAF